MTELIPAAKKIQDFIDSKGWKFCFIGGLAVQRWGEIRLTKDVDLTLITEFGDEAKFVDELRQRVLLISEGEIPLDGSQDWNDVRSIIIRHGKELNWPYIRKWLPTLLELKGTPEAMTTLENMRKEFSSPQK
jgi:hypothetical protein